MKKHIGWRIILVVSFVFFLISNVEIYANSPGGDLPLNLPADELTGTSWQLVKFQGGDGSSQVPDDRTKYTMVFGLDGKVAMRLDCNRGSGTYTSAGAGQIQFGQMAMTMAYCPEPSLADNIAKDLGNIRSYTLKDGHLFLGLMADGGSYEYEPINKLTGTSWLAVKFQGGDGTIVRPRNPENYTLAFGKDGRTSVKIDCNTGGGAWTVRGSSQVEFGPVGTTRMACGGPADPFASKYAALFANVRSYSMKDGRLYISLPADAGTYEFSSADPLTRTGWSLVKFQGNDGTVMRPTGESKYTLAFAADGILAAQIDCNKGSGTWSSSGPGQIQIGPMATTMMACPPSPLGNKYPRDLGLIRSYSIRNGNLFLSLPGNGGTYEYESLKTAITAPTPGDPLTGTAWSLIRFEGGDGKTMRPRFRQKYTAAFARAGVVAVQIDCNKGNGSWSSSGPGQIQFGPVALTRMACPPSQLTNKYTTDWGLINSYVIRNGHLFLSLPADGGTYEYEPLKGSR